MGGPPYTLKDKASAVYVSTSSAYLSEPYELVAGDELKAKILSIKIDDKEYAELKGKEITLVLYPYMGSDYLFFSKKDWIEYLREYGLIVGLVDIVLKIERAVKEGVEIPLYTKRDLEV
ncbi:hypothetical protein KEJ37_05520 [Candidatus Bathyarchaeota archaeon]|nr:hypothetical protein [Candidatus Bathyarchaeota archaeon]